ncbi:hypothetical protein ACQEWB_10195 [Streptomyces sp. CA-249302]|uniref:hypothetical protein n=1 Tax=Streptomyces sp. CA-249302 TaxID=3240058 RepID=UPI003D8DFD49
MHWMLTALFPSVVEKGAAAVLLICHEGWNLAVLKRLKVPDSWPNADGAEEEVAIHRMEIDKVRRSRRRHFSNNLVNLGEGSPGEAMSQIIAMTEQVRETLAVLGQPSDLLLWSRGVRHPPFSSGASGLRDAIGAWFEKDGADLPERMNSRLLRHTSQVLYGRPRHNTRRVHEEHYLRRDERVIEDSKDVVAAGLEHAVQHARETVRMRVVAAADGGDPEGVEIAERTGLTLPVAERLAHGDLDTAVAACEDIENSPLTANGGLCMVSFLLCFACTNALATPRHLPRIAYLHQSLEALRSVVSKAAWVADWAEHHHRIGDLLNRHTDLNNRVELLSVVSKRDKELIDRLLERRLDP